MVFTKARKKIKKTFTLIECMIAFALMAILIAALFSFYRQNTLSKAMASKGKKIVLSRMHTQERLSQIFQMTSSEKETSFHTDPYKEAIGDALFFCFDNGIDPDPAFCHEISAILFLDQKQNLCLTTKSSKNAERKEILLENISSLSFSFFDPASNTWEKIWTKELPAFFILSLKDPHSENPLEYAFFLPTRHDIIYQKKGL
jgi:Tfp pilus assembly protein PilE